MSAHGYDGHQIYNLMHMNTPFTSSVDAAREVAQKAKEMHDRVAYELAHLQRALDASWEGEAAAGARAELAKHLARSEALAVKVQPSVPSMETQTTVLRNTRDAVEEMPPQPETASWFARDVGTVWGLLDSQEDKNRQWQEKNLTNKALYDSYYNTSTANAEAITQDYHDAGGEKSTGGPGPVPVPASGGSAGPAASIPGSGGYSGAGGAAGFTAGVGGVPLQVRCPGPRRSTLPLLPGPAMRRVAAATGVGAGYGGGTGPAGYTPPSGATSPSGYTSGSGYGAGGAGFGGAGAADYDVGGRGRSGSIAGGVGGAFGSVGGGFGPVGGGAGAGGAGGSGAGRASGVGMPASGGGSGIGGAGAAGAAGRGGAGMMGGAGAGRGQGGEDTDHKRKYIQDSDDWFRPERDEDGGILRDPLTGMPVVPPVIGE